MARQSEQLTGLQKAAILMVALGPDLSANILKNFKYENIEAISCEIANLGILRAADKQQVIEEFLTMSEAHISYRGGIQYARELLDKTVGPQKANEILEALNSMVKPFGLIRKIDPMQLYSFIMNEHPQTIALILSYLDAEQAGAILSALPKEMQSDIALRIAAMERTSPEVVKEVESVLERKISTIIRHDFTNVGGVKTLVKILNMVDRTTEKGIIEEMEEEDPQLAEEIKNMMFVFEDIVTLDDSSIRRILREIDFKDLAIALKGTNEGVLNKIYKNLSKRAGTMLQEDMESLGPIRLSEVEKTQQKIVQTIRKLDQEGEIIISRGGHDDVVI
ncbi:MAG: flagellar motor switch protein FliG [Syntrophomonadaceae bacterium]|nr:flagellar motor switch protein FliG [Syntrophomonadaceae bacterium]